MSQTNDRKQTRTGSYQKLESAISYTLSLKTQDWYRDGWVWLRTLCGTADPDVMSPTRLDTTRVSRKL